MATIIRGRFRRHGRGRDAVALAARLTLALALMLFTLAALRTPRLIAVGVATLHPIPPAVVGSLAVVLPWLSAFAAVYLAIGLFLRFMTLTSATVILLATGALVLRSALGASSLPCGALPVAGSIGALLFPIAFAGAASCIPFALAGNTALIVLAAIVHRGDRRTLSADGFLFRPLPADLMDEEDLPPTVVLLTPLLAQERDGDEDEDEDGA